MRLFHFSEEPGIARFEPRASAYTAGPVVWAVGEDRAANYLLPRDCPRVCARANAGASAEEVARLLGEASAIVAVEAGWMERIRAATLYRYEMPPEPFRLIDEGAGYWVADESVTPLGMTRIEDLPGAIAAAGATLVALESLWALHDAVKASGLMFSMIRMRNAAAVGDWS